MGSSGLLFAIVISVLWLFCLAGLSAFVRWLIREERRARAAEKAEMEAPEGEEPSAET